MLCGPSGILKITQPFFMSYYYGYLLSTFVRSFKHFNSELAFTQNCSKDDHPICCPASLTDKDTSLFLLPFPCNINIKILLQGCNRLKITVN